MRKDPSAWVRPHIRSLVPYAAARDLYRSGLLLDANENPLGTLAPELGSDLNRYPDPSCAELRAALADWLGVGPERIGVANGSDEGLDLLIRTFVDPSEWVVVAEPTYGMYRIVAEAHGAKVRAVQLDQRFDLDLQATLEAARGAKAVFLCSPNNPTGNLLDRARLERLISECDALIVVDEAYVEFSDAPSLVALVAQHRNLVVLRTFSKAWGLAAARVGYWIADPEVVEYVDRVNLPYPLSGLAARAALLALGRRQQMERWRRKIVAERERLAMRLRQLGLGVFPSDANFLLVRVPRAPEVYRRLAEEFGIVVRDRSGLPRLEDCLRVSVGRPEETDRLCAALEAIL